MRYFFFSYQWSQVDRFGFGNLFFSSERFPSNSFVKESARDYMKTVDAEYGEIVITNWQEFKSEDDYKSYVGKNNE